MARLILFLLFLAAAMIVITAFADMVRSLGTLPQRVKPRGDTMPDTFKTVAYVLLIMLMFGVITGWLGGL